MKVMILMIFVSFVDMKASVLMFTIKRMGSATRMSPLKQKIQFKR